MNAQGRPTLIGVYLRAHLGERVDHSAHRAGREAFIAYQRGRKALPGQQSREQTHGGTGIAAIQVDGGLLEAMEPDAVHGHPPLIGPLDLHAHRPKDIHGGDGVCTLQETGDMGRAFGDGAEHDRAVRDGLVSRHSN